MPKLKTAPLLSFTKKKIKLPRKADADAEVESWQEEDKPELPKGISKDALEGFKEGKKKGKAKGAGVTVESLLNGWRKEAGDRPVVVYEEDTDNTPRYPTRFPKLNVQLGGGPRAGAIIELFGPEDSGKSSTAIALAADIQKQAPENQPYVLLLNYEGSFDWEWARTLGLDTTTTKQAQETGRKARFIHLRPKSLEQGIGRAVQLLETGQVCCMIIDSVYAGESKESRRQIAEQWSKGDGKGAGMAVEARQWGKAWTSLKGIFLDYNIVAIAVNQEREEINQGGPPKPSFMGKPTTSPRGKALKFYAWVRLITKGQSLPAEERKKYGNGADPRKIRMRIIKNKTSKVARGMVEYVLLRGVGFDLLSDLIDCALEAKAIKAKGAGMFIVEGRKVRGREKLNALVRKDTELQTVLREQVDAYLAKKLAKTSDEDFVDEDSEGGEVEAGEE